jgi:hypothetical protein
MDKSKKTEKREAGAAKKVPFFARYLAAQELSSISAGKTLKYPSDGDDEDLP